MGDASEDEAKPEPQQTTAKTTQPSTTAMSTPLLVRLGLSRPNGWEPPSVLDRLAASPVQAVAVWLWQTTMALRTTTRTTSTTAADTPIRIVCISDTHDLLADVPPGDLLIHAGDLTNAGTPTTLQRQLDWLAAQPHRHKIVIAGNHDTWLDPAARVAAGLATAAPPVFAPDVHYLQHDRIELDVAGRRLTIFGAPDIPRCGPETFAFQYDHDTPPWDHAIPADVDILVTHTPPRFHRDLGLGCPGLLREAWRVRPSVHVFGHVHWGAGRELLHWDASQRAYEALLADADSDAHGATQPLTWPGRLYRLGLLLVAGVLGAAADCLWPWPRPSPDRSTVLINAAQMHGNTGRLGTNVQVVDL